MIRLCLLEAAEARVKLEVSWVKGHQGRRSTGGYINDRVDRMARRVRDRDRWSWWTVTLGGGGDPVWQDSRDRDRPFIQALQQNLCRPLRELKQGIIPAPRLQ